MTAVAFDTLKLTRKLRDTAQMSQVQAEGVADALAEAMSGAELATKGDLAEAQAANKADLMEVKTQLKADLVEVDHHLEIKIAGVQAGLEAKIAGVQASIAGVQAGLEAKIAETKSDILKTMLGAVVLNSAVVIGAMFGLAKLLGH